MKYIQLFNKVKSSFFKKNQLNYIEIKWKEFFIKIKCITDFNLYEFLMKSNIFFTEFFSFINTYSEI